MEFSNQVINNVILKAFPFTTLQDVKNYNFMSKTAQSRYFAELVISFIKIIDKKAVYYYNTTSKLWLLIDYDTEYYNFVADFCEESSKKVKLIKRDIEDEDDLKSLKVLIGLLDNKVYINEIMDRSYSRLFDSQFVATLDNVKYYFPIKNGKKINFKTLKVYDRTEADYFSYESPVDFIDGPTPNADLFFGQVMPNEANREYLRTVLGYTLTTETCARVFFIWYGKGSNAKSFIARLMELILKKEYHQCDPSIFIKSKSTKGGPTPELMALLGKRMSVYSEGETADKIEMNNAGLKQISGEDSLCGRALYANQITFIPYTKLHMLTNFTPPLNSEYAIKQRLRYVFLDSQFVDNPDPKNKKQFKKDKTFTDDIETKYLSEIFTWIIKGAHEFYKTMTITMTEEFKERTEAILSNEDSIKTFTDRKIITTDDKNDYLKKNEIFEAYKTFCNNNSQRCQPRSSLFNRLEHLNLKTSLLNGYDVYRCVKLVYDDPFGDLDTDITDEESPPTIDYEDLYKKSLDEIKELKEQIKKLQQPTQQSFISTKKVKKTK